MGRFNGKTLLFRTGNVKDAFNLHKIFRIIKYIGITRYLKFMLCLSIITIVLFNSVVILKYFLSDIFISAFLESFVLMFSTNAFYRITC